MDEFSKVIKIQALIRGFLMKKKYVSSKLHRDGTSKYFKADEAKETLSKNIYKEDAPLETRTHIYKSGAVYQG